MPQNGKNDQNTAKTKASGQNSDPKYILINGVLHLVHWQQNFFVYTLNDEKIRSVVRIILRWWQW